MLRFIFIFRAKQFQLVISSTLKGEFANRIKWEDPLVRDRIPDESASCWMLSFPQPISTLNFVFARG